MTDADLALAEQALRRVANLHRQDAARQGNPIVREEFEKHAADCERIAERMSRFRESLSG